MSQLISTNVIGGVTLHVRGADAANDFSASKDLAAVTAKVPRDARVRAFKGVVPFAAVRLAVAAPDAGVSWRWSPVAFLRGSARTAARHAAWTVVKGQHTPFFTEPGLRFAHRPPT